MSRRAWFGGFGAGVLAGAIGAFALMGGEELPQARAQAAVDAGQPGRYQLMTWSTPAGSGGTPSYGAYVLDTATGHLWLTRDGGGLEMVGRGR